MENIASLAGSSDSRNLCGIPQASEGLYAAGTSGGTHPEAANVLLSNGVATKESSATKEFSMNPLCSPSKATCNGNIQGSPLKPVNHSVPVPVATLEMPSIQNIIEASPGETVQAVPSQCSPTLRPTKDVSSAEGGALCSLQNMLPVESAEERFRVNYFDLNCTYNETQDCGGGCEEPVHSNRGAASINCPSWLLKDSHQSSPPQTSDNSDSSSVQSLSSSNGDAQVHSS